METCLEREWTRLSISWKKKLDWVSQETWFHGLSHFLETEIQSGKVIFPQQGEWLRSLHEVPFDSVRVVILGQDPYHGPGQATGAAFAVPNEFFPKPPSLMNILKEITSDLEVPMDPSCSDLTGWMSQGVLLLNTILTVRDGDPFSHHKYGWEKVSDAILSVLNERAVPIVFLLWGVPAQKKRALITNPGHQILEAPHPSPLSSYRGFFGCRHFSQTNTLLSSMGLRPIDWARASLTQRG